MSRLTEPERGRTPERQLLGLLGLAARARRAVSGTDAVRKAVRDGDAALVLLAGDASPTQHAKLVPLMEARGIRYHRVSSRERLGAAIGRSPVSALGLTDEGFARRAVALIAAFPASQE